MSDPYAWWRLALAMVGDCRRLTREQLRNHGLHETQPECGFYRTRKRTGHRQYAYEPVAIWRDDTGELRAACNGEPADPHELWTWCAPNPLTEETYRAVAENGQGWPDQEAA